MHPILNRNLFMVKEHVGMFKAANNYDIYDPQTNEMILQCREPKLGMFTKFLRFTDYKRMTPFRVVIQTPDGKPLIIVKRGVSFFRSHVKVYDENEQLIGGFKQRFWSIGGKFEVLDDQDKSVCMLKGKWTGWDFRFLAGDEEYAHVSKKWAGLGKELFTSADTYMLEISNDVPPDHPVRELVMAAVMVIDMVLKE
ncbi:MAG: phospholipid scramblase-related protein [Phycisphaeraceae bacterium]